MFGRAPFGSVSTDRVKMGNPRRSGVVTLSEPVLAPLLGSCARNASNTGLRSGVAEVDSGTPPPALGPKLLG